MLFHQSVLAKIFKFLISYNLLVKFIKKLFVKVISLLICQTLVLLKVGGYGKFYYLGHDYVV